MFYDWSEYEMNVLGTTKHSLCNQWQQSYVVLYQSWCPEVRWGDVISTATTQPVFNNWWNIMCFPSQSQSHPHPTSNTPRLDFGVAHKVGWNIDQARLNSKDSEASVGHAWKVCIVAVSCLACAPRSAAYWFDCLVSLKCSGAASCLCWDRSFTAPLPQTHYPFFCCFVDVMHFCAVPILCCVKTIKMKWERKKALFRTPSFHSVCAVMTFCTCVGGSTHSNLSWLVCTVAPVAVHIPTCHDLTACSNLSWLGCVGCTCGSTHSNLSWLGCVVAPVKSCSNLPWLGCVVVPVKSCSNLPWLGCGVAPVDVHIPSCHDDYTVTPVAS